MTINQKLKKLKAENSFEFFVKYLFKEFEGRKFEVQGFHSRLFDTFERIYKNELHRVIINIPPRHSKTEMTKMFCAWIIAKNPKARMMMLSYSDKLAEKNCASVRDYIASPAFQELWSCPLKADDKGKKSWSNVEHGGMYSASAGGQVTGFGAGLAGYGCEGGIIVVDDPLKPDDADSETLRGTVNNRFVGTVLSRTNDQRVPIVIIMQRIHEEDLSGFLLDGGDGSEWHHLKIPVWGEDEQVIWPRMFGQERAEIMNRSQPYIFAGQYLQEPAPLGGGIWKEDWFEKVDEESIPSNIKWDMYVDGSYTKDTNNDPTGILVAGRSIERIDGIRVKKVYLLHNEAVHLEMPELVKYISRLATRFKIDVVRVEPKASGISLVQLLRRITNVRTVSIKSKWAIKSKIDKAHDCAPYIEGGQVKIVKGKWNVPYLHQVSVFPAGKHDEDVDTTSYAIEQCLMKKQIKVY